MGPYWKKLALSFMTLVSGIAYGGNEKDTLKREQSRAAFALRADRPNKVSIMKRACGEKAFSQISETYPRTHQVEAGVSVTLGQGNTATDIGPYIMYQCSP